MSEHKQDPVEDGKRHRRLLPERTIPLEDAAEVYEVSVDTLRRWISEGKIRGYRFGPRFIRIEIDDLEALFVPLGPEDM